MVADRSTATQFELRLDGYEGPLDALLEMARMQKVDLGQISVRALVDQYLYFINEAKTLEINVAADYLVMAAWLVYLKSSILLPPAEKPPEPTGEELALRLASRLRVLEAMQKAADNLWAQPKLGTDRYVCGTADEASRVQAVTHDVSLYDLLKAYGDSRKRVLRSDITVVRESYYAFEDAIERVENILGTNRGSWVTLESILPEQALSESGIRTVKATLFSACLDLTCRHKIKIRQDVPFGPISACALPMIKT